ncbi:MAG TPA: hypothetical protein VMB48_10955 [Steroidobacteraceae bacterium]|nr:hypothetical protein [Steroidobacteraceae bacterium]
MKFDHGDARAWLTVPFVVMAGLALYRYIPRHHFASETATAGVVVLMVLKHVGLFGIFGAPGFAVFRRLRANLHRRAAER